jgi:hypothetical protein
MVMQSGTAADPSVLARNRATGMVAYYQITNNLKSTGFNQGLSAFKDAYLQLMNERLPAPARLVTDCDLTILKTLMDVFDLEGGYDYARHCQYVWKQVVIMFFLPLFVIRQTAPT